MMRCLEEGSKFSLKLATVTEGTGMCKSVFNIRMTSLNSCSALTGLQSLPAGRSNFKFPFSEELRKSRWFLFC